MAAKFEKSYFDVLGLCCSSEIPVVEKILKSLEGVKDFSVVLPTKTVVVVHDSLLVSQIQIAKALNQARLEASIRPKGVKNHKSRWPSPYAVLSGAFLLLSLLKYAYDPLKWIAVGAIAVGIVPVVLKSIAAIRNLTIEVNILVLIAVSGSVALGDYWEAATIVFLFTTAEWLESRASHKATAAMSSLIDVVPQRAVIADTGEEINADEVKLNTILAVKAGEAIPIDGVVVDGTCEVDEKFLTGESLPVAKEKDSSVWASTINLNGYITIRTTSVAEDCVVARMAKLVEESQNKKSKVQRFMDKCAKYYTPIVVLISAVLAVVPLSSHIHDKKRWFHLSLVVLVSGCPCPLLLSTPVAMFCALSEAARLGILFKGAEHIETLAKIKSIGLDKTGTITKGEFQVSDFTSLQHDDTTVDKLLYWISSIESKSSHPMAAALIDYARETHQVEPQPEEVDDFQSFLGEGIAGRFGDSVVYIGNRKIASRAGFNGGSLERYVTEGMSTGYVFIGSSLAGVFHLKDSCRTGAREALKDLKSRGIKTVMLTGDSIAAANHARSELGDVLDIVHAELLPNDKERIIKELQKEGPTAMVGDGVNDAPALAAADIGISMGVSGSALATETGDVVLITNDIQRIPKAYGIAKKTQRKIIENVVISFSTKAGILGLAIAGHPLVWAAVLADVGTCLLVIFNSMLLLQRRKFHRSCSSHSHKHKSHGDNTKCCSKSSVEPSENCCSNFPTAESTFDKNCCSDVESQKKCCSVQPCSSGEEDREVKKPQHCAEKNDHHSCDRGGFPEKNGHHHSHAHGCCPEKNNHSRSHVRFPEMNDHHHSHDNGCCTESDDDHHSHDHSLCPENDHHHYHDRCCSENITENHCRLVPPLR